MPLPHHVRTNFLLVLTWLGYLYNLLKDTFFSISLFGQVKGCVMYLLNHRNQKKKKFPTPKWGKNPIFGPQNDNVVILWWGYLYNFFKNKYFSILLFRQVKGCVMYLLNHRNQKK